ncbi:MAG: hypothetical protein ABJB74_22985 [Gemmatimonas sp.]
MSIFAMGGVLPTATAAAQKKGERVRILAGSVMRTAPGGQVIGVLSRVYEGPVEMVQGGASRLRISGFVSEQSIRLDATRARGVAGAAGAGDYGGVLRTGPSEKDPALATLQRGAVLFAGQKSSTFLAVNRTIWVDNSRLAKLSAPDSRPPTQGPGALASQPNAAEKPATPPAAKPTVSATPALPPMQIVGGSPLRTAPNGDIVSSLPAGTLVNPLRSENGWTRVAIEGWVSTKDLTDASAKAAGELSAADIRADPSGTKGRIVRWTVEALSFQLGDALRRELNGEPYLLARGPGKERSILYLAVPDSLLGAARALAPLTTMTVTARVRSGKSEPGGVPILDLLELVRR